MTTCESFCSWKMVGKSKNAHKVRREFRCQVPECGNTNVVDSEYDREVSWTDPAKRVGYAPEVQTTIHELLDREQEILESAPVVVETTPRVEEECELRILFA